MVWVEAEVKRNFKENLEAQFRGWGLAKDD